MYSDIDILYIRWMIYIFIYIYIYIYIYICIQDGVMRLFRDIGVLFELSERLYGIVVGWIAIIFVLFRLLLMAYMWGIFQIAVYCIRLEWCS
jgi:hypothetical protein